MNACRDRHGFTLLEVIVTMVIFAFLGSMLLTFLSSSLGKSHEPVFMVRNLVTAQEQLEGLVVEYNSYLRGDIESWADFKAGLPESCDEITGEGGLSSDFESFECRFLVDDQEITALFSEIK